MLRLSCLLFIFSFVVQAELSEREKFLNQFRKDENKVLSKDEKFKKMYEAKLREKQLEKETEQKKKLLLEELKNHPDFDIIGADNLPYETLVNIKNSLKERGLMDQGKKDAYINEVKNHNQQNPNDQIVLDENEVDPELMNRAGMGGGAPISISQEELENPIKMPPEKVEQYLQQSYRQMSREESRSLLGDKLKGKPLVSHPKFVLFMDELIREPYAISDAMGVVQNRSKLGIYVGFLVFTFFLGIFYKKVQDAKNLQGMDRLMSNLTKFLVMNALRIGIFVTFFGAYLRKTATVFVRIFL